jgi:hypothetical protein
MYEISQCLRDDSRLWPSQSSGGVPALFSALITRRACTVRRFNYNTVSIDLTPFAFSCLVPHQMETCLAWSSGCRRRRDHLRTHR